MRLTPVAIARTQGGYDGEESIQIAGLLDHGVIPTRPMVSVGRGGVPRIDHDGRVRPGPEVVEPGIRHGLRAREIVAQDRPESGAAARRAQGQRLVGGGGARDGLAPLAQDKRAQVRDGRVRLDKQERARRPPAAL